MKSSQKIEAILQRLLGIPHFQCQQISNWKKKNWNSLYKKGKTSRVQYILKSQSSQLSEIHLKNQRKMRQQFQRHCLLLQ